MRKTLLILLLLPLFALPVPFVFSQTPTPTPTPTPDTKNERLGQLEKEIADLENQLKDAQGKIKTLSSQISVMNNQIKLTELKINQSKGQLAELEKDIEIAQGKISNLESSLNSLSTVLLHRIVATYKTGNIEPWELLASSEEFSDVISRMQYVRIVQAKGKKLVYDTEQTKVDYANQKEVFENKQKEVEALKKQLENYTSQLSQQKKDKEALLTVTRGDEKTFQDRLARARAEQAAILGIIAGKGQETLVGNVGTGGSVGTVISGTSACSSGTHLHFSVYKGTTSQNPSDYLSAKSFTYSYPESQKGYYGSLDPHGSYPWPLDDPIEVNQGYGSHGFAQQFYPSGLHDGIDMEGGSSNVKAVRDGKLYRGSITCGGGTLLYSKVEHSDDIQTYYLHIYPK